MPVTGNGQVNSWTINYHAWLPDMTVPFIFAAIELVEQPGLLVMSNIVNCEPGEVAHVDGSTAVVLSRRGTGARSGRSTIGIEAVGSAMTMRGTLYPDDFSSIGAEAAADMMWSRTDLRPADVDTAQLYDGYSILTLNWLEALRICPKGEGGRFIEGGHRISLEGEFPMNTSGGQLAAGRLQGYGHTHEACTQLWGRAGARKVKDAKVALVSNGGMGLGCMLLVAE